MRALLATALLAGCTIDLEPPRNCDDRTAYYPDADGDGLGEPTTVYIGCEPPAEDWVTTPRPTDAPDDTGDSGQ